DRHGERHASADRRLAAPAQRTGQGAVCLVADRLLRRVPDGPVLLRRPASITGGEMIVYILRRCVTMALMLLLISALVFVVIKLPPGDILTNQIEELRSQGEAVSEAKAQMLMHQYGLDRPTWEQYASWIGLWPGPSGTLNGVLQGNWGWSFEYQRPVSE